MSEHDLVARGWDGIRRRQWPQARSWFEQALANGESAEAYEGKGLAAWWMDDGDTAIASREAAYRLYRQTGRDLEAARTALWVSGDYEEFRGEIPIARGWRARARRLLEGLPRAPEHAWLPLFDAETALFLEADAHAARTHAAQALAMAVADDIRDVEILARGLEGLALVEVGEIDAGIVRLDEAAASALAGELQEETWTNRVLCYLIYACERVRDHDRAAQWCVRLQEVAEQTRNNFARGVCRAHYAGVLISRGKWSEAEAELAVATPLLESSRPFFAAESIVRLAELRRRQGRTQEAAELFRSVEWHPTAQLGLAELFVDTGRPRDAHEQLQRHLRSIPDTSRLQHAAALELQVRIEALLGNHRGAAAALASLDEAYRGISSPALRASAAFSAGMMSIAEGEHERARAHLEDAVTQFEHSRTPYEAARARLELASLLVTMDRLDRAHEEASSAHGVLEALGSSFFAGRAAAVLEGIDRRRTTAGTQATPTTLTERQLEILRLISRGLSDRDIANTLSLSEHTIHRHVSNILTRLGVRTRAAAVAVAIRQGQP
jgi:DNA-binding CsgD family transcriptional regulator